MTDGRRDVTGKRCAGKNRWNQRLLWRDLESFRRTPKFHVSFTVPSKSKPFQSFLMSANHKFILQDTYFYVRSRDSSAV